MKVLPTSITRLLLVPLIPGNRTPTLLLFLLLLLMFLLLFLLLLSSSFSFCSSSCTSSSSSHPLQVLPVLPSLCQPLHESSSWAPLRRRWSISLQVIDGWLWCSCNNDAVPRALSYIPFLLFSFPSLPFSLPSLTSSFSSYSFPPLLFPFSSFHSFFFPFSLL